MPGRGGDSHRRSEAAVAAGSVARVGRLSVGLMAVESAPWEDAAPDVIGIRRSPGADVWRSWNAPLFEPILAAIPAEGWVAG